MPKHVDYAGGILLVNASLLDPELTGLIEMPILAANFAEGEATDCDFCLDHVAVYEVDAEEALGEDGGHNTFYCQECATRSATAGEAPEVWLAKDTFCMQEIIVWKGEYDAAEFSVLHTVEADVNGRPDYLRVVEYFPYRKD